MVSKLAAIHHIQCSGRIHCMYVVPGTILFAKSATGFNLVAPIFQNSSMGGMPPDSLNIP